MTTFLLIRHATNDFVDRALAGRMPGVHLNAEGRKQAEALAERLARLPIEAIYSSPLERTLETAGPLSKKLGLEIGVREGVIEVDMGRWTGLDLSELMEDPRWGQFNRYRSGTRVPDGEITSEVQARVVVELERLRERHPDGIVAVFSHGDPIKTALAYYAGIPLDFVIVRFRISPASVTVISVNNGGPVIHSFNDTGELPDFLYP